MNWLGMFNNSDIDLYNLMRVSYLNNLILQTNSNSNFRYGQPISPFHIIINNNISNFSLNPMINTIPNLQYTLNSDKKIKTSKDSSTNTNNQEILKTCNSLNLTKNNKTEVKPNENHRYIFNTITSRKTEKTISKMKINHIYTRVHNKDCLLKKIKAKYLKFLYSCIKDYSKDLEINIRKFNQNKEVRNLNVIHNRDNFINLTISEFLKMNNIISDEGIESIMKSSNSNFIDLIQKKIKYHYQFHFLKSSFFKNWIRDPIKIYKSWRGEGTFKTSVDNKNCIKFPKYSKNLFKTNTENYENYKKLLLIFASNFIFHFQNNSLKFGKKCKKYV